MPLVAALGVLGWLCEFGRLYFIIQALGFSLDLPLVLFVTLVNAVLTTVPLTPGGLGIVEPGIVGLLTLGMPRDDAVSVAFLDRSISYLSIVVIGAAMFLLRQLVRSRQAKQKTSVS